MYKKTKIRKTTVFLLEKFRPWSNIVKDVKKNVYNQLSRNIEGPGGRGSTNLGVNIHLLQQRPKGSAQGAQEPGHLPEDVGQTVLVFWPDKPTPPQPNGAEEVVDERTNRLSLTLFQMIQKMKLPGGADKMSVIVGL